VCNVVDYCFLFNASAARLTFLLYSKLQRRRLPVIAISGLFDGSE
jgi:hypothetical protein